MSIYILRFDMPPYSYFIVNDSCNLSASSSTKISNADIFIIVFHMVKILLVNDSLGLSHSLLMAARKETHDH